MSRFTHMLQHPARILAYGFGSGFAPKAPGTFGSLVGLALGCLIVRFMPPYLVGVLVVLGFALGVWACGFVGRELGAADHGSIVWDEVVAMAFVISVVGCAPLTALVAFGLFRLFDIAKPQPIRYVDAKLKSGFGVMFDDVLAATYTLLVITLLSRFVPGFL